MVWPQRPLSGVPPGEEAAHVSNPLLAEAPREGPARTRKAGLGVKSTRTVGKRVICSIKPP